MAGSFRIAYKLLINDRGKCAALLLGISFAVLLMVMTNSLFSGRMNRAPATIMGKGARLWMQPYAGLRIEVYIGAAAADQNS